MKRTWNHFVPLMLLFSVLVLTACGGGGSSSDNVGDDPSDPAGDGTVSAEGIVFVSARNTWNEIWIMNVDGTTPKRLSSEYKDYFGDNYPSSSSDGKIVFSRDGVGIVVLDSTGEKVIKSYPDYDNEPHYTTWSADGEKIYYTVREGGKHLIYSINPDGTGLAQVSPVWANITDPLDEHPSVSPDGSQLLFSTNRSGNVGIVKMPIGGGTLTYLTYAGGVLGESVIAPAQHPTWSPDGLKIAFAAYPGYPDFDKPEQIYVMNADGSGKQQLTNETEAGCRFPAWSPDGTKLVFQKDYPSFSDPTEIWIMNADGTGGKALTDRAVTHYDAQPCFIKKPR